MVKIWCYVHILLDETKTDTMGMSMIKISILFCCVFILVHAEDFPIEATNKTRHPKSVDDVWKDFKTAIEPALTFISSATTRENTTDLEGEFPRPYIFSYVGDGIKEMMNFTWIGYVLYLMNYKSYANFMVKIWCYVHILLDETKTDTMGMSMIKIWILFCFVFILVHAEDFPIEATNKTRHAKSVDDVWKDFKTAIEPALTFISSATTRENTTDLEGEFPRPYIFSYVGDGIKEMMNFTWIE
uniref:Uncharacterized protein n=1 Tax=Panagrolaimus sp. JU765 TaxID=591449 RepID=A0AC34QZW2_9BILA